MKIRRLEAARKRERKRQREREREIWSVSAKRQIRRLKAKEMRLFLKRKSTKTAQDETEKVKTLNTCDT